MAVMSGVLSHFSLLKIPHAPRLGGGAMSNLLPFRLKKWKHNRNGYGLNWPPIDANVNRLRRFEKSAATRSNVQKMVCNERSAWYCHITGA